jgi:hypothetical protein
LSLILKLRISDFLFDAFQRSSRFQGEPVQDNGRGFQGSGWEDASRYWRRTRRRRVSSFFDAADEVVELFSGGGGKRVEEFVEAFGAAEGMGEVGMEGQAPSSFETCTGRQSGSPQQQEE